jgi:glycosyltransferase involved in cell wall biosynthesis
MVGAALVVPHLSIFSSAADRDWVSQYVGTSRRRKLLVRSLPIQAPGPPTEEVAEQYEHLYRLASSSRRVLFSVSLLAKVKRVPDLVDAFSLASTGVDGRQAILLIAGSGEDEEEVVHRAERTEHCYFLGSAGPELKSVLFDVGTTYVSLSRAESFGVSLAEAILAGKELLATPVGILENLESDPSNGVHLANSSFPETHEFALEMGVLLGRPAPDHVGAVPLDLETPSEYSRYIAELVRAVSGTD